MSITVKTLNGSGRVTTGQELSAEVLVLAKATSGESDSAILAAIVAYVPSSVVVGSQTLYRESVTMAPISNRLFSGSASYKYASQSDGQPGDREYECDWSIGTVKITSSISTVAKYAKSGETAPDHKGAMNVTKDGVQGAELSFPQKRFTIKRYYESGSEPSGLSATIDGLIGYVNSASITITEIGGSRTYAAGELMLIGGQVSVRKDDGAIVSSLVFAYSPNATGLSVGEITSITKNGWDYLWVQYQEEEDSGATPPRVVKRPIGAYVERVYPRASFSALDI